MNIKDSGDRTAFKTGAVRDMHEGKGRLDLLPCSAILELAKHCENGAIKYGERNVDKGIPPAFTGIASIEGEGEIVSTIINEINSLLNDYGFEKVGRIVIRNRRNGRLWK